ncbi:LOW QUALITY PROTEIN: uncharacterized protein LOC132063295 [Lycium ferocissimum]|uniref:LOW QUALITY PROTEIN: uncharacterized protein LOC132063295 n=1 Tax=Lycium ferocissimum TaxID=112874 RepID=UPI002815E449|nr:LOW QUALITY PROTEIN: uncharacterized protein LOC132063295 [Lycium ferocissimum]
MAEQSRCRLQRGQYLGEISALCFLHLPPHFSQLPFLLAGTGSQILVYDLTIGKLIRSFDVFDGIRVHGVSLQAFNKHLSDSHVTFKIALYGERRVKLFSLQIQKVSNSQTEQQACFHLTLSLVLLLPKFSHWVLDVSFLKWDGATPNNSGDCLAIGCSDNSVHIWDMWRCSLLSRVGCSERCLLYSMRIWGDDVGSLHVASGTIFNEVLVWKVGRKADLDVIGSPTEDLLNLTSYKGLQLPYQQYEAINICKLTGHEGSIFRLAWSADGFKLVSVSDDRSARIWMFGADGRNHVVDSVFFGHSARIWDCCIFDSLIITAGEDCTCRVWGMDGTQLTRIKEHVGRGIWRCLYDPETALLVTAGFDSAIKVHHLQVSFSNGSAGGIVEVQDSTVQKEEFALYIPNFREHFGVMNSKSEYVRCLHFSREDSLYVATNNGYVYHAELYDAEDVKWTELLHIGEEGPIICMDLLSHCSKVTKDVQNWVAVGNGKGTMMIAKVVGDVLNPRVELTSTWSAEPERQLLGTYWCKSLGPMFLFTSDPRGTLKLWRLFNPLPSVSHDVMRRCSVSLIAEFRSCFGMRIMCLDASVENEVLVCGDIRGNLLLFPLQRDTLFSMSTTSEINISPLSNFRGAHGISTVCSISIASFSPTQLEIHSTGGDGCICYFEHDRSRHNLEFVGIKQVKELSTVQSVFTDADQEDGLPSGSCAIGFSSSDFIIWNLISETKVLQVTCGGWRRPHSYFLGDIPEMKNCFAYVKDGIIYVHRHWVTTSERVMYPKNFHLQFHGREIHTLCFISQDSSYSLNEKQDTFSEMIWVATGCEDGTVRLTRYASEIENWSTSKLLGEHVGGSAVRSIFFVSRLHRMVLDANDIPESVNSENWFLEDSEDFSLLISVGAKRVVTAWKQKSKMRIREGTLDTECNIKNDLHFDGSLSSAPFLSTSFQWLSTDMPTRERNHGKQQNNKKVSGTLKNGGSFSSEDKRSYSEPCVPDIFENDWRYLAVTAFLVQVAGTRCSVCFVVVACSDATVTLRALLVPYRLWFDVALLTPLSSPVLALRHIVVPTHPPVQGNIQFGNRYIIISGSTDGCIAIWDLTDHVENFMRQLSAFQIGKGLDSQKRPRTGRGSQGGRQWRSLRSQVSNKITGDEQLSEVPVLKGKPDNGFGATTVPGTDKNVQHHALGGNSHSVENTDLVSPDTSTGMWKLQKACPLHVFEDVHQSGVNCLHVSDINGHEVSDRRSTFYVLSGGDDQSLNCLRLDFSLTSMGQSSESSTLEQNSTTTSQNVGGDVHNYQVGNHDIKFMLHDKITSAHSSAVKGVWTDGRWVFSTGLDQRIRCWHLEQRGKLTEHKHMVVSVPEPEALDARSCGRNHYQIAVAGRGMQMFDFIAPDDMEGGN